MGNRKNFKGILDRLLEAEQLLRIGIERGTLSVIERDILLEKLRASYEELLFDKPKELEEKPFQDETSIKTEKVVAETEIIVQEPENEPEVQPEKKITDKVEKSVKKEPEATTKGDESTMDLEIEAEVSIEPELDEIGNDEITSVNDETSTKTIDKENNGRLEKLPTTVLGEKYQGKKKFRNESLGAGKKDMASKLQNKPIGDLTKAIGINDKFLFTKELFRGNAELYSRTIKQLNDFTDINDALIYIQENFDWDNNNEAANQLIDLVRRKLLLG